jgi:cbb3-type cytochrome oxidase subunit 1
MAFSNSRATTYNDKIVRQFAVMTVVWGVVGMLVGVIIAAQLAWPELNLGYFHFAHLWAFATLAHQRSDLCVWRLWIVCNVATT